MPQSHQRPRSPDSTPFQPGYISFHTEVEMIQTQALRAGVFVVLLSLLPLCSQLAHAQVEPPLEPPCNNSKAKPAIRAFEKNKKPLMPKEIQDDAKLQEKLKAARLKKDTIKYCLENDKPLVNHVIDFDLYVETWQEIKDSNRTLHIRDSVLWSFKEEGLVSLAAFARDTEAADGKVTYRATAQIQWKNMTPGPSFSAERVEFLSETSFFSSRFPSPANFSHVAFLVDGADFRRATFADGTALFGDGADFGGATFGDGADFGGATFGDGADFGGATFGDEADFGGRPSAMRLTSAGRPSAMGLTSGGSLTSSALAFSPRRRPSAVGLTSRRRSSAIGLTSGGRPSVMRLTSRRRPSAMELSSGRRSSTMGLTSGGRPSAGT